MLVVQPGPGPSDWATALLPSPSRSQPKAWREPSLPHPDPSPPAHQHAGQRSTGPQGPGTAPPAGLQPCTSVPAAESGGRCHGGRRWELCAGCG